MPWVITLRSRLRDPDPGGGVRGGDSWPVDNLLVACGRSLDTETQGRRVRSTNVPYSEAFKTKMVKKMLGSNGRSATALSMQVGISQATLSRWLREACTMPRMNKTNGKSKAKKWTTMEKLRVVVEASQLSDEELGAFLRREGIHEAQLQEWRKVAEETFAGDSRRKGRKASREAKKIKALERDLHRKDKALAEVSALLVLKKKPRRSGGSRTTTRTGRPTSDARDHR